MHPMNGLLLIDKSSGMTSHDVVSRVRRILGIRAIGHAGTLDPLASGLLILLIGEATKVSDYILNGDKGYEVGVKLGVKTDSMDITGQVVREAPVDLTEEQIRQAVDGLQGGLELEVPVHSAVKVDGKKLYQFAHKGETPDVIPKRVMEFYGVKANSVTPDSVVAEIHCSKGSFVRAWANELGERLGCGGTVQTLRRIRSAPFDVSRAITLEELERRWEARQQRHGSEIGEAWVALRDALPHFERIDVSGQDEYLLRNGQISKMVQALLLAKIQIGEPPPPIRVINRETDDLLALLIHEGERFYRIRRVFNNV